MSLPAIYSCVVSLRNLPMPTNCLKYATTSKSSHFSWLYEHSLHSSEIRFRFAGVEDLKMMALVVKIAMLLLVVFTAAALENSHGVDSDHDLHPYSSSEPFPSMIASEKCVALCVSSCQDKKGWKNTVCLALCITECVKEPSQSLSEIVCAADCTPSSNNNLRYDSKMDDRVNACSQKCKKDTSLKHE